MATLSIVATPIGNLGDITFRAIETLKAADLVLCEDTRESRKLLDRYGVSTPTESYHARSAAWKTERIIELLEAGKNLALITDAGTPGISDPGAALVAEVRAHFAGRTDDAGEPAVSVVPIPGPSALVAALSAAGAPTSEFTFLGFLPHKKGRQTLFSEIALSPRTVVFYESPHRIMKALESLAALPELSGRTVFVARELTKMFESFVSGSAAEVLAHFVGHPDQVRGEFVVMVSGRE